MMTGTKKRPEGQPNEPEFLHGVGPSNFDNNVFAAAEDRHCNSGEQQNEEVMLAPYSERDNVNFRVSEGGHEKSLPALGHLSNLDTRTSSAAIIGMGLLSAFTLVLVASLWVFTYRLDSRLSELEKLAEGSNDVGTSLTGDPQNNDRKMQPGEVAEQSDDVEEQPDADEQAPFRNGQRTDKQTSTDQGRHEGAALATEGSAKKDSVQAEETKIVRSSPTSKAKKTRKSKSKSKQSKSKQSKATDSAKETPTKKNADKAKANTKTKTKN